MHDHSDPRDALSILYFLILGAAVCAFAAIVFIDRYHRAHPVRPVTPMPLPQSAAQMQLPPDLFPIQSHDVKG